MPVTRILYNDRCPICRAEIVHYKARARQHGAPLEFEDLHQADLDAWALTADQAKRRLHARLPSGEIVSGMPAFAEIWNVLPNMRWLGWLVMQPGLRQMTDWIYNRVAAPWLYRKQLRRDAEARLR